MSINGDTSGVTNLHNQMMGYLTCFGVFVAVAYMFIISALTAKISSVNRRKYCVALIITLVVMAYFDTVLYSTDNVVFVVFVVTVLFALDKHNSEKTLNGKNNYSEGFLK